MLSTQRQEGGDHSTNIQAHNVTLVNGLTYNDVKEIALDVFRQNFDRLSTKAAETVTKRAIEVTEKFLGKLLEENPGGIAQAEDPSFQTALLTVQREYAITGDEELGDLLVRILVARTKEEKRTLKSIILTESLTVAPKLTREHLDILSFVFLVKHTHNKSIKDLDRLGTYLDVVLKPYVDLSTTATDIRHLEFCSCISVLSLTGFDLIKQHFLEKYPGLFSKGFTRDEYSKRAIAVDLGSPLLISCLHSEDKFQIGAVDNDIFVDQARRHNASEADIKKLITLGIDTRMNSEEGEAYLKKLRPYIHDLLEVWQGLQQVTLTSVGIAIAHANLKSRLKQIADLSTWLA